MSEREPLTWRCGGAQIDCGVRTLVMGVLNVTPDSFSDGGRFLEPSAALAHGIGLVDDGADILDVGGESTRPGSAPVPEEQEMERVVPLIEVLASRVPVPISVDTRKASVARAALAAGATIVNDISAGADPDMFGVVQAAGAGMVLMHMQGEPKTMQIEPHYGDVVGEVRDFLAQRIEAAVFAGIQAERVAVDPGIGFGKDLDHNLRLLHHVDALRELGRPILVGPSRKRFIGTILDLPEDQRVEGTAGAVAWVVSRGADLVRVHDVKEIVRVVRVIDAIARAG